jgi:hypothetical protein
LPTTQRNTRNTAQHLAENAGATLADAAAKAQKVTELCLLSTKVQSRHEYSSQRNQVGAETLHQAGDAAATLKDKIGETIEEGEKKAAEALHTVAKKLEGKR